MTIPDLSSAPQASLQTGHAARAVAQCPVRFRAAAGVEGCLEEFGPERIKGWISRIADPSPPVQIDILAAGRKVGQILADIWRHDVQESRHGDGRWGFLARPPAALADGHLHDVMLAFPDGQAILPQSLRVCFKAESGADQTSIDQAKEETRPRSLSNQLRDSRIAELSQARPLISFIVVFYNMPREAARTLTSLARAYQRDAEDVGYEVICVDNGANATLSAEWIASFGPEFRLFRPEQILSSPVAAMNAAARGASAHHLALMIDGAHILSPGVIREVADAIADSPGAVIGLRQWFVGGDQRFLSLNGWTRAQEDMLFDRVAWPSDGYELFAIATPVWESPNHWFDGMSESNCLFVPAELFTAIGGFDEAFDEAGAGYANLDLFRRAVEAADQPVVALIGEASFHQFHDGTTTNVDDGEKDRRVRGYEHKYMRLRAAPWVPVDPSAIRVRGRMHCPAALANRQRPLSPAQVGVTHQIRPAVLPTHFDELARDYLVSVYAEARLQERATWRGNVLGVAPPDAFAIAEILHQMHPARVVAINLPEGLLQFLREGVDRAGAATRFVIVGDAGIGGPKSTDLCEPSLVRQVRRAIGAATDTVVLYQPRPQDGSILSVLQTYGEFVSLRSYLVCIGTANGQPWLGYSRNWTMNAIRLLTDQSSFVVDHTRTAHFITSCPSGFLQRIGPVTIAAVENDLGLVGVS